MSKHGPEDPLVQLRREARELGIPESPSPEETGVELDSADDIIARLRSRHGPILEPPAAEPDSPVVDIDTGLLRRRRRVGLAFASGLVAAAVVGLLVVQPWSEQAAVADEPAVLDFEYAAAANIAFSPGRDSAATLLELSAAASRQTSGVGSGPIQHVVTDNWFAELTADEEKSSAGQVIPTFRETWLQPDGSLTVLEHDGKPLSADGRTDADVERPSGVSSEMLPAGTVDPSASSDLPLEAGPLREALFARSGCESGPPSPATAACIVQAVIDLHSANVVPSEVSAAIWQVMAAEPDLRLLGDVTDRLGREGVGIAIVPPDSPQFRNVLIISPVTGALLGTETVLIAEQPDLDLEAPAIFSFTAYVTTELVGPSSLPSASSE
ncbi:CU044_5270 family protein [Aeromicrobium sp. Sec7.5]|uniref:CU044_5270 family protein n=1 Tax=Aeromicrobium sp. Sec7.5 TaxID=3121276 RepID=UPI002FE4571B